MNSNRQPITTIKKQHISAAVEFAIDNIPGVDENTLSKFLELINVTGNFGSVSEEELLEKMRLFCKYIPKSCHHSLRVLVDLLDTKMSVGTVATDGAKQLPNKKTVSFFVKPSYVKQPATIQ